MRPFYFLSLSLSFFFFAFWIITLDQVDKLVKEVLGVLGTGCGLGVELDREEGAGGVVDALVGTIVGVDKELLPLGREGLAVDGETVVLYCFRYQLPMALSYIPGR